MYKIAVIGGQGFIGKNLVRYLADRNYDVISVDRSFSNTEQKSENKRLANIHHTAELIDAVQDAKAVIWLVHASVPSTKDDSLVDDFSINISPIVKFMEQSEALPLLEKFIYMSSGGTVYGNPITATPIPENQPKIPISNYGLSKKIAESYIEYLSSGKKFQSIVLRPSNVYGPYQNLIKPQGIIGFAFKAVKNNLHLDLYDGGKVVRDFVYVDDLASAVEALLTGEPVRGSFDYYNVGSSEGFSIRQILDKIETISGLTLNINHKSSRNFDCAYSVLNSQKLKDRFGWKNNTSIDEGLRNVWEWIKIDVE